MLMRGVDIRLGTDIESIRDVEDSVRRYGERYLRRVFTRAEISACGGPDAAPEVLAPGLTARFCAKEAAIKVLRPSDEPPQWRQIEILGGGDGWPSLSLTGTAASLARRAGINSMSVSFSHGPGVAVATVVGVVDPPAP